MSNLFVGAWTIESDRASGLGVFSEKHYSFITNAKDRKSFQNSPPSQAEQAEAFASMGAMAGIYVVTDNTLTIQRDVVRDPSTVGDDVVFEYSVNGDEVTLKYVSGSAGVNTSTPGEFKFRKVS